MAELHIDTASVSYDNSSSHSSAHDTAEDAAEPASKRKKGYNRTSTPYDKKLAWYRKLATRHTTLKMCMDDLQCSKTEARRIRDGKFLNQTASNGRPPLLTDPQKRQLVLQLEEKKQQQIAVQDGGFRALVMDVCIQFPEGGNAAIFAQKPTDEYFRLLRQELDLRRVKGQNKTDARRVAEGNVRSALSLALNYHAILTLGSERGLREIAPNLQLNFDATSFLIEEKANMKCIVVKQIDNRKCKYDTEFDFSLSSSSSSSSSSSTSSSQAESEQSSPISAARPVTHAGTARNPIFLKMYATIAASGGIAKLVIVVLDKQLPANACQLVQVQFLSPYPVGCESGYILFQRTTQPTVESDRLLFIHVLKPYIDEQRKSMCNVAACGVVDDDAGKAMFNTKFANDPAANCRALVMFDGEPLQLVAMRTVDMIREFDRCDISMLKTAASCTAIQQPCDVGPLFRTLKARIKTTELRDEIASARWKSLYINCYTVLEQHNKNFRAGWSTAHMDQTSNGLCAIVAVLQQSITTRHVIGGWRHSGLHPFNLNQIMAQCTAKAEQKSFLGANMIQSDVFQKLLATAKTKGRVSEVDFTQYGVPGSDSNDENEDGTAAQDVLRVQQNEISDSKQPVEAVLVDNPDDEMDDDNSIESSSTINLAQPSDLKFDSLPLQRQRAVWLNHSATIAYEAEKLRMKQEREAAATLKRQQTAERKATAIQLKLEQAAMQKVLKKIRADFAKELKAKITHCETRCSLCAIPYRLWQANELTKDAEGKNKWDICHMCNSNWCPDCIDEAKIKQHKLFCSIFMPQAARNAAQANTNQSSSAH